MIKTLLASLLTFFCLSAAASGTPYAKAVFVHLYNPGDVPAFYRGRLGILQPSYERRHLVVAYRRLMGLDLNEDEARLLLPSVQEMDAVYSPDASLQEWRKARRKLGVAEVKIIPDRRGADYTNLPNCSADAFRTATRTLRGRMAEHGRHAPALRQWLQGQDAVFANCAAPGSLPTGLTATAPLWLRQDRAYQSAAALYYRGDYVLAAQGFASIAADPASPWRPLATYLVARARVRLAEAMPGTSGQLRQEALAAIERVLQDAALSSWHLDALKLRLRLTGNGKCNAGLEKSILAPRLSSTARQEVQDFLILCSSDSRGMAKWLRNLRDENHPAALREALAAWGPEHGQAWLLAAMMHGDAQGNIPGQLLQAASRLQPEDPAWLTVAYYRLRAMRGAGQDKAARELADALLAQPGLDGSARNLLLAERIGLAPDLAAFLRDARRAPVEIGYPGSENGYLASPQHIRTDPDLAWRPELRQNKAEYFDNDSGGIFNAAMPLVTLRLAAEQDSLPLHMRRQLRLASFTRAFLLGELDVELATRLAHDYPRVRELAAIGATRDVGERHFLAAVALLRLPGATPLVETGFGRLPPPDRIGLTGPRWWDMWRPCWLRAGGHWDWRNGICATRESHASPLPPPFLQGEPFRQAQEEAARLQAVAAPASLLGRIVLNWTASHTSDPRVPEALYLVVQASRYGSLDCNGGLMSQQSFRLLHTRFKSNSWATKTRHWYGDRGCLR